MARNKRGPVARGSTFAEPGATVGIRWPEDGRRPQRGGFRNETEARDWFDAHVKPRLRRGGPSSEVTFAEFVEVYFARWQPPSQRTVRTMREWIEPAVATFGDWTLGELQDATDDVARWRAGLGSDHARYTRTRALRQVLAAAKRWKYIAANPAADYGPNPQPRGGEPDPLQRSELDAIAAELSVADGALVIFAAETGLRTNEWPATERRDVDRRNPAVSVMRRYAAGTLTAYPKTSRRRVPLTPRALAAVEALPARLETALLFPAVKGGHVNLDNWRARVWTPALDAAGVRQRGPYALRDTFATEALAAGVPVLNLARLMGTSVSMIERNYGGQTTDAEGWLRALLAARSGSLDEKPGVNLASGDGRES